MCSTELFYCSCFECTRSEDKRDFSFRDPAPTNRAQEKAGSLQSK